jgi:hypothetical protein
MAESRSATSTDRSIRMHNARLHDAGGRFISTCSVIASQRVGAKRRPMTGSAKQSIFERKIGLLRRKCSSQ